MFLEDGAGTGYKAGVTNENMLRTSAITSAFEYHINEDEHESYSAMFSFALSGTNKCIGYIKNNNVLNLVVSEWMVAASVDTIITFKFGDSGTPGDSPATVTPVSRNAGSGTEAQVTAYLASSAANGISGLSGGSIVVGMQVRAVSPSQYYSALSGLILPKNKILTIYSSAAAAIQCGMGISFHD